MRTRTIRFARLCSLPGMHHIKLEKEVELEPGDDEALALIRLKQSVDTELGICVDHEMLPHLIERLRDEHHVLEGAINDKRRELERLRAAIRDADSFVLAAELHGIKLPDALADVAAEIPF